MIAFKLAEGGWSWAVTPRAVLQVFDHTQLVAEIPAPFILELVEQRLRDLVLSRKLAALVADEPLARLMAELEPRRTMPELPELRPLAAPLGLRAARRAAKLSTKALAEKAGISTTYLRNLETGTGDPSPAVAQRLAEALGLEAGDLFPAGHAHQEGRPSA